MGMSGQLQTPAALTQRKEPPIPIAEEAGCGFFLKCIPVMTLLICIDQLRKSNRA
jgi:hypothetical protein